MYVCDIHMYVYAQLLQQAEDENDVKATRLACAEQAAEMAEFDENFIQATEPREVCVCVL